jgi:cytoskeletal protein CcmA (bactofilin family)
VPETVIGEYVNVKGELAFDRLLRIDGCFEGKLVSDGDLIVGPQGKLIGDVVNIRSVLVEGHLIGNLIVESVALKGDAYVHGDITCKSMVMDGTAKLVGRVNVHPGAPKEMDAEGNLIYVRAQSTVSREAIPANHVETDAPESKIKGEFHFPKSKEDEQNVILSASESKKSITSDIQVQNAIADGASAQQEQEVTGENGSSTDGQVGELQREINEARDKAAQNRESEELELSSLRAEVERLKAEDKRLAEEARQRREALATEAAQLQSQVTAAASAAEVVGAEEAEGNKPAEEAES